MNLTDKYPTAVEKKAREAIARYNMLDGCDCVLVGVSGGADSMSLLSFFCSVQDELGIKVMAAHINHCLRGAEADRDENFVRDWCNKNDVTLFVLHADVKKLASEHSRTVEEEGRNVRYAFFAEKCAQTGAVTATAHTLSDSIETQIMNYARGAGMHGLCGIPPKRDGIIRPLIRCTRAETEEYCRCYGIKYVDDSTNFSHEFTRNKVRLDLVPMLYKFNPSFDKAAARLIDSLEEDESCLCALAESRLAKAKLGDGVYDTAVLKNDCPDAVLSRCISKAASDFTGKAQEAKHIGAVCGILKNGCGKTEIVGGCFALIKDNKLIFEQHKKEQTHKSDESMPFIVGNHKINGYDISIVPISYETLKNFKNVNKEYFKNSIDCGKINGNASVRTKIQGDRFSPVGRNITKTLKKLFNEEKIPVCERETLPVAADNDGVFWVAGIGVSERCRVTTDTKNAVMLKINKFGGEQLVK